MNTSTVENVVLVTVDSLRSDAVGYGAPDSNTPVIDEIAERGTTFENAFANGNWTPFSFPGILASTPVFAADDDIGVRESATLASALQAEGVHTGGFNAANGFLTDHWGYDSGFDEFESFVGGSLGRYSQYLAAHPTVQGWLQLASSPFRRLGARLSRGDDDRPFADTSKLLDVERGATEFVEEAEEPFFLWIHYMDAHTPYVPAPRHLREVSSDRLGTPRMLRAHVRTGLGWGVGEQTLDDLRTLYDAAVRQIDESVGRIQETLAAEGVADETCVVVAGDHGEEFQEHGHLAHYPKLYDELIHVPFVVDVPGADSRSVSEHVGLDAIPPTVCDLLGVPAPSTWRGRSLAPTISEGVTPPDDPVVSVTVRGESVTQQPIPRHRSDGDLLVSARTSEWIYVENTETGDRELYHRPSDPTQQANRYDDPDAEIPEVAEQLQSVVHSHAASLAEEDDESEAVDSELATRLEALGYR